MTPAANQAADIYSTGIIFHEILHRNGPFGVECMELSTFGKIKKNYNSANLPYVAKWKWTYRSHHEVYYAHMIMI